MWFCGLASITSNSRMLFAFARDGGLLASRLVARVSPRFKTPHVAVWVSAAAALAVSLWADAYSAMTALSTIALYMSYGLPIAAGLFSRKTLRGPWHLGRYSGLINSISVFWVLVIAIFFVLPPNELAGYTFAGCLMALGLYWLFYMRARFKG